jgi:N-acetylmuramoyl-L-alanine amidase
MKIVIDAGHGPDTPGKRCPDDSMREYHFNSKVAEYVVQALKMYEVEVMTVHSNDRDVPLQERTDKANQWGADCYVSIHANAFGEGWTNAEGIETFVLTSKPKEAYELAAEVQTQLIRSTGRNNRGVKLADYFVLRKAKMTSILVECGFMTNKSEATLLKSDAYRLKCASAIVTALVNFYKLKKVEKQKPSEVSSWAKEAQQWVIEQGISDGKDPQEPVTREQVWTMLKRALAGEKK